MLTVADFGVVNPPAVLIFTSTQQRTCASVTIIDDNLNEGTETFTLTLSSTNFQVNILTSSALVIIADNEGKIKIFNNVLLDTGTCRDVNFSFECCVQLMLIIIMLVYGHVRGCL